MVRKVPARKTLARLSPDLPQSRFMRDRSETRTKSAGVVCDPHAADKGVLLLGSAGPPLGQPFSLRDAGIYWHLINANC